MVLKEYGLKGVQVCLDDIGRLFQSIFASSTWPTVIRRGCCRSQRFSSCQRATLLPKSLNRHASTINEGPSRNGCFCRFQSGPKYFFLVGHDLISALQSLNNQRVTMGHGLLRSYPD